MVALFPRRSSRTAEEETQRMDRSEAAGLSLEAMETPAHQDHESDEIGNLAVVGDKSGM